MANNRHLKATEDMVGKLNELLGQAITVCDNRAEAALALKDAPGNIADYVLFARKVERKLNKLRREMDAMLAEEAKAAEE